MHTPLLSPRFVPLALAALAVAAPLGAACGPSTDAPGAGPGLPTAVLACPEEVRAGEPFVVDGSGSEDPDGPLASVSLRLTQGEQASEELQGSFLVASSGIATVILSVADSDGNTAEARCRVNVVGASADPGTPDPGTPGDDEGGVDQGDALELSGSFALVAYDRPELEGGALDPQRQCAAAPSLALVTLEQEGTHVALSLRTCTLSVPRVQVFAFGRQDTEVPDAFVDALPTIGPVDVQLSTAGAGATFTVPPAALSPMVIGAALGAANEALPSDSEDPRVRDDDGDGAPGVTLVSNVGQLEVVFRRTLRALSGVVLSSDEIEGASPGSFRADTEASMLSFLGAFAPAGEGLPSTFRMVRVDGAHGADDLRGADGALDCSDLRAHEGELVERLPPEPPPAGCASF